MCHLFAPSSKGRQAVRRLTGAKAFEPTLGLGLVTRLVKAMSKELEPKWLRQKHAKQRSAGGGGPERRGSVTSKDLLENPSISLHKSNDNYHDYHAVGQAYQVPNM